MQGTDKVPYPTYKYKTYRSLRHRADLFGPERAVQNSPPRGPRRGVEVPPPLGQVLTPGAREERRKLLEVNRDERNVRNVIVSWLFKYFSLVAF